VSDRGRPGQRRGHNLPNAGQHRGAVYHVRPVDGGLAVEGRQRIHVQQVASAPQFVQRRQRVESGSLPGLALHGEVRPPRVDQPVAEGVQHHRGGPAEPGRHVQRRREHRVDHDQVRIAGRDDLGEFRRHGRRTGVTEHRCQRVKGVLVQIGPGTGEGACRHPGRLGAADHLRPAEEPDVVSPALEGLRDAETRRQVPAAVPARPYDAAHFVSPPWIPSAPRTRRAMTASAAGRSRPRSRRRTFHT
jgi:hypothetical protein